MARLDDYHGETLQLADRGIRLVAKIVDGLAFGLIFGIVMVAAVVLDATGSERAAQNSMGAVIVLVGFGAAVALLIYNLVLLHRHGQTIGKRLLGIRIVRSDGSPCELVRVVFARWLPVTLLGFIPLFGAIIGLVDPLMIFRDDHRCMHDLIADTIVVKV